MKQICIIMTLALLLCIGACGNNVSDTSSTAVLSSSIVSLSDDVAEITLYNETTGEEYTLSDNGVTLRNADQLLTEAAEFTESGGILHNYLFVDHKGITVTNKQLTDIDYAITLCVLLWSPEEDTTTRADADRTLKSYFGIQPDHVLNAPLLLKYSKTADGYTLSDPMPEGNWSIHFTSADYLGNGYLRFSGTADYTNGEGKIASYSLQTLLTRCDQSNGFGFSLRAFSIAAASAS